MADDKDLTHTQSIDVTPIAKQTGQRGATKTITIDTRVKVAIDGLPSDGTVELSVTEKGADGKALHQVSLRAAPNNKVYANDTHFDSSQPNKLGNTINPELAAKVYELFKAVRKDGELDGREANLVQAFIHQNLPKVPMAEQSKAGEGRNS